MSDRRCKAKSSRTGLPCKKPPMTGGFVCEKHGGRAPQVKRAAAKRVADMLADAIDPDRALREVGRLAYSDIRTLFDDKGNMLPVKQWSDDLAAAIASVEVVKKNLTTGDNMVDDVIKVRVWDKPKNLEMLFKHLGLLKDTLEHTGKLTLIHELDNGSKD